MWVLEENSTTDILWVEVEPNKNGLTWDMYAYRVRGEKPWWLFFRTNLASFVDPRTSEREGKMTEIQTEEELFYIML